ncbi:cystathionine beta-synthase [Ornithinimicrobium sp. Arc0846-15]|nr:cystathionine beta-synthase [Ornithinimicrobium laminariae]
MRYAQTVIDLVGNTPLVKLNHVTDGVSATVLAKIEYLNPGGSSKDRIAKRIIDAAEEQGLLKPGGTIVEPTSGNTGIGLALIAQQRGYNCIFVCPDKVGEDKRNVLRAYGAEVVVCPTSVSPEDPRSYYSVSDRLAAETPGGFKPNQYENPEGPRSHYETTGPEIWSDTEGKITHFVAGVGTGGTISGTGKFLKDVSEDRVQVIGADPQGSVYSGGSGRPYLVEGVGEDIWPGAYDQNIPDSIIEITDAESFEMTRRLAREEGLLVGGSCGLAAAAAIKAARDLGPEDVVVVLLPDGGRGYLGKIFNDGWMAQHGFMTTAEGASVADLVAATGRQPDAMAHLRIEHTVAEAIVALKAAPGHTLPVLKADLPVVLGEVVGTLSQGDLLEALASGTVCATDSIESILGPMPTLIGTGESFDAAREALGHVALLVAMSDGKPIATLTTTDILDHVSEVNS